MKVLLTGGSGNLGQTLVPRLLDRGDTPVILDVRTPRHLKAGALFIEGSILDRPRLTDRFRGCDCIVHIAAWHGIHEDRGGRILSTGAARSWPNGSPRIIESTGT